MFKQECAQFLVQPWTRNNSCLIKFPKLPVSVYSNGAKGPLCSHYHDNRTSEVTIYAIRTTKGRKCPLSKEAITQALFGSD